MNKLDRIKAKKASRKVGIIEFDDTKQLDKLSEINQNLQDFLAGLKDKDDASYAGLNNSLKDISQRLEQSLAVFSEKTANLDKSFDGLKFPDMPTEFEIKGLNELIDRLKAQAEIAEVVSGNARSDNLGTAVIIEAPKSGSLVISDIIIANTSSIDSHISINDGERARLFYPAPLKGGAIHALKTPLVLSPKSALTFKALTAANTLIVSAVGTLRR